WIFEPYEPKPDTAPLIVFNHGWLGINPKIYGAWIDHLVRRGNIVVYPRYQVITTPANKVTGYAIDAVKNAIDELNTGSHVRPELDKFAIVGHSLGGVITANMAVLASSEGLPEPKAIMSTTPGSTESMGFGGVLSGDLHLIPSSTLLLSISCADDEVVVMEVARRIYNETTRIPAKNKDYITMVSDYHGDPALVADHTAPSAEDRRYDLYDFLDDFGDDRIEMKIISADIPRDTSPNSIHKINSLDYYGFWKLFDALTDAAFYGKNREYALGNTQEQRFMGKWTDGSLIKELKVGSMP
ncbi:alpha/beta hydrolase fold domain-containing protein, partial [Candidatus Poribacteria bacterium]|nr:alpha/beta hydrolase fold domain-containing protein [Candidatus Poribacteria bacterium]